MNSQRTPVVIARLLTLVILLMAGFYFWVSATEFMEDTGACLFHIACGVICLGLFFVFITRWGRQEQLDAEGKRLTADARRRDGLGFFPPHPLLTTAPYASTPDSEKDGEKPIR